MFFHQKCGACSILFSNIQKRVLPATVLALVLSGCGTKVSYLAVFPEKQREGGEAMSVTQAGMHSVAPVQRRLRLDSNNGEWLIDFAAAAEMDTRVQVNLDQGYAVNASLVESYVSARGRPCKQIYLQSQASQRAVDVLFCRSPQGWEAVTPLQRIDFAGMGLGRVLKYVEGAGPD